MRIVWDKTAERNRDNIGYYILERFGADRLNRFIEEVEKTAQMITNYPAIGAIDPLFADRQKEYRSIIVGGLSKLVYRVEKDTIHIVAFWDCRREPEATAAEVKRKKNEK